MGWKVEKGNLDDIARNIINSRHGSFLKSIADAWLRADRDNKQILKPAWVTIIEKYGLDKEAEGR
ncbi:hypothetical protein ES703_94319 [subsurface metagenome]